MIILAEFVSAPPINNWTGGMTTVAGFRKAAAAFSSAFCDADADVVLVFFDGGAMVVDAEHTINNTAKTTITLLRLRDGGILNVCLLFVTTLSKKTSAETKQYKPTNHKVCFNI